MSFEEEFDSIIRQKSGEAEGEYPFEESNWEKARAMLDAERKTKRPVAWLYTSAALILGLGVAAWLWMDQAGAQPAAQEAYSSAESKEAYMTGMPFDVKQNAGNMPGAVALKANANTTPAKEQNNNSLASVPASGKKANTAASAQQMAGSQQSIPSGNEPKAEQGAGAAVPADAQHLPDITNNTTQPPVEPAPEPVAQTPVSPAAVPAPEDAPETTVAKSREESDATVQSTEIVNYEPLFPLFARLPLSVNEPELRPVAFNQLAGYDEYYKKKHSKTHFMNVEAGAAYMAGWDVKGGKDGQGFNWFGGLNYGLYVSKKIALGAGVQVYNLSHISTPFYSTSSIEYGFGSTSSHTLITTNSLYYAALPVKMYYVLNQHNRFGLGCNIGMPIHASSTVETYGLSDNVRVNQQKATRGGVYEGTSTTNVMLSGFYSTQVGKRLYLSGEALYGVSDIFSDLSSLNNERAMGLRLSLQYVLFDK